MSAAQAAGPAKLRVEPHHLADQEFRRHVEERAVLGDVGHELAALGVERLQQRVALAGELQRRHAELLAQADVERRRRLDPFAPRHDLDIAVIGEHVGADGFEQPRRGEMVLDVGEAEPGRNSDWRGRARHRATPCRRNSRGLRQHARGAVGLGIGVVDVGVVADFVAHGAIEHARLLDRSDADPAAAAALARMRA